MEKWKDISGYEGLYRISSEGVVMALPNRTHSGGLRKLKPNKRGYVRITLCKNGLISLVSVHRLVAVEFVENPLNKNDVNHINGIRYDNRAENLEWCNQSENQLHAYEIGLQVGNAGSKNGQAKLNEELVSEIRKSAHLFDNHQQIADKFGVSRRTINRIINNSIWKQKKHNEKIAFSPR